MKHGYPTLRMNVEKYVSGLHFDLQEAYKRNERAFLFSVKPPSPSLERARKVLRGFEGRPQISL